MRCARCNLTIVEYGPSASGTTSVWIAPSTNALACRGPKLTPNLRGGHQPDLTDPEAVAAWLA